MMEPPQLVSSSSSSSNIGGSRSRRSRGINTVVVVVIVLTVFVVLSTLVTERNISFATVAVLKSWYHDSSYGSYNNSSSSSNSNNDNDDNDKDDLGGEMTRMTQRCLLERGTDGYWYDDPYHGRQTFYLHGTRARAWYRNHKISEEEGAINNFTTGNTTENYILSPMLVYNGTYGGNRYNWYDRSTSSSSSSSTSSTPSQQQQQQQQQTNTCRPIQIFTKDLFCQVAKTLNIHRIMFVGDSLSQDHRASMIRLVGFTKKIKPRDPFAIDCSHDFTNIPLLSFRENIGPNLRPQHNISATSMGQQPTNNDSSNNNTDNNGGSTTTTTTATQPSSSEAQEKAWLKTHMYNYGPETPFCHDFQTEPLPGGYCPWHLVYNTTTAPIDTSAKKVTPPLKNETMDPQQQQEEEEDAPPQKQQPRTLLIMNQGAHFHSIQTFTDSLDLFVKLFQTIARPNDIVMFRSTIPGHKDCFNTNKESTDTTTTTTNFAPPNMTHDKFLDRYGTTMYDWNLFDSYNRYAATKLSTELPKFGVHFHYLNVYNMTVLRPDEHVSPKDCLHYTKPGPIDFWNHLLITNLLDLSTII